MLPDYRSDNPYQALLETALTNLDVTVIFPVGYRRVFPIYRFVASGVRIDIIHLHWMDPYLKGKSGLVKLVYGIKLIADIILCKVAGKKIVWTVHNLVPHDAKFSKLEILVYKALGRLSNAIIAHSNFAKQQIEATYNVASSKVNIIQHGHYKDVYSPLIHKDEARKKLKLPPEGSLFLNFGMIKPYKGIEELIVLWQHNNFGTLLIAGNAVDEAYRNKIRSMINDYDNIIWADHFIANEHVHEYFSAADVVVLPFRNILTSGSLLLALTFSKPVIVPAKGGISELFPLDYPLLYNNDEELAQRILNVPMMNILEIANVIELSVKELDWQKIAQQTKQVYVNA